MRDATFIRWTLITLGSALLAGGCLDSQRGGTVADASVEDSAGEAEDTAQTGRTCCESADDCEVAGHVCVEGFCLAPVDEAGRCWRDADCDVGLSCFGDSVCSCEAPCPGPIEPGWCMADEPSCCYGDQHCDDGQVCATSDGGTGGRCVPEPGEGYCYGPEHCDGMACAEATTCPCFASGCEPSPGVCLGPGCCVNDDECAADNGKDYVCEAGNCLEVPPDGQCWRDAHCGAGKVCTGGNTCPCGLLCAVGNIPGQCVPDLPEDCCFEDDHCPSLGDELVCAGMSTDQAGTCQPPAGPGECWADEDCPGAQTCEGESTCPCGVDCSYVAPGVCSGVLPACCGDDEDCPAGYACGGAYADATGAPSGVCLAAPLSEGSCWGQAHCPDGAWCLGAQVCPCNADCDGVDVAGTCVEIPAGCCAEDADCADGHVCRGLSGDLPGSCVPDPGGPQCLGDVACCWEQADCGANSSASCQDVSVCGCIELCPTCGACQPDQMGWCQ